MIIATPTTAYAEPVTDEMEHMQTPNVTVVEGSQLRVTNGNGQTLRVYNVTGVQVRVFKVDGMDKCYDLNLPKGCYIINPPPPASTRSLRHSPSPHPPAPLRSSIFHHLPSSPPAPSSLSLSVETSSPYRAHTRPNRTLKDTRIKNTETIIPDICK